MISNVVTETLHQVGAIGIIFRAEFQQPQGIYAVFQRRRRGGLNGKQRQIRLRGLDFALFQIIGNDVEDDRYDKQQDDQRPKQVFPETFHDALPVSIFQIQLKWQR